MVAKLNFQTILTNIKRKSPLIKPSFFFLYTLFHPASAAFTQKNAVLHRTFKKCIVAIITATMM
ncbi:hypothetical protein CHCC15543_4486 [Bacillus licheniformis]|nr:hypothetical protein CHCC15543_4486 [Bacillus licheniformis]